MKQQGPEMAPFSFMDIRGIMHNSERQARRESRAAPSKPDNVPDKNNSMEWRPVVESGG